MVHTINITDLLIIKNIYIMFFSNFNANTAKDLCQSAYFQIGSKPLFIRLSRNLCYINHWTPEGYCTHGKRSAKLFRLVREILL